jgi:hypothetical protein
MNWLRFVGFMAAIESASKPSTLAKTPKMRHRFAQPGDVKGKQAIGMAPGHTALIRLLRGAQPLSADIRGVWRVLLSRPASLK